MSFSVPQWKWDKNVSCGLDWRHCDKQMQQTRWSESLIVKLPDGFSLGHYHVWICCIFPTVSSQVLSYSCQFKVTIFHNASTHISPGFYGKLSGTESWSDYKLGNFLRSRKFISSPSQSHIVSLWHYRRFRDESCFEIEEARMLLGPVAIRWQRERSAERKKRFEYITSKFDGRVLHKNISTFMMHVKILRQ